MPHAYILPDPIHTAIQRHRAAYDAYQVAPEGYASVEANDEYDAASDALVATACSTRFGALALLGHLSWWLVDEAEFKDGHQPAYGIAEARVADLTLFLGDAPSVVGIPAAAPSGRLVAAPTRAHWFPGTVGHALEHASEALSAVLIIAGGAVFVGLASLL